LGADKIYSGINEIKPKKQLYNIVNINIQ